MAEKFAELGHATVKIDADRSVREAGARGDFGAGHTFYEAKNERFAIGFRQRPDGFESLVRFGLIHAICGVHTLVSFVDLLVELIGRLRLAVKIDRAIAGNGAEPAPKARDVAQSAEAGKRVEENILDEVFDCGVRNF